MGLTVADGGRLLSNGDWQVRTGSVVNQGRWQGNNLLLDAGTLDNNGALLATDAVTLTLTQGYTGGAAVRCWAAGR
ncbi:hypothetical protein [Dickeya dadantii]|uniref:hypothetical protein n=1 Tax=Dickeya dadantii TaxID=204038 RepID=UPI002657545A|nr:hypothetical protein [Dickeya dadantii]